MTVSSDDTDAFYAVARDYGGYIQRVPRATIRATTASDVVAAMRLASERRLKLAVRGAGHSTHGQAQAEGGLVLDLRGLDRVLELTPDAIPAVRATLATWGPYIQGERLTGFGACSRRGTWSTLLVGRRLRRGLGRDDGASCSIDPSGTPSLATPDFHVGLLLAPFDLG